MKYTLTDTEITIICTFRELVDMDSLAHAVYATPTPQGAAAQVYIGARPHFRYDFLLANVEDFCEALGIDTLGWEEMTEDELAHQADDEATITVPRARQDREA